MSIRHDIDKTVKDVKDAFNEGKHRGIADAEQASRDAAGDEMTAGEKADSMLNQAKHSVAAEVDRAKRKARDTV
jgi:hypothetical protein